MTRFLDCFQSLRPRGCRDSAIRGSSQFLYHSLPGSQVQLNADFGADPVPSAAFRAPNGSHAFWVLFSRNHLSECLPSVTADGLSRTSGMYISFRALPLSLS